ncbi:MAG: type II secretion system protein, partial [Phycisphaerales bacterium]
MTRRGFTLVETVVVVAVCAALAAILVPALRAASGAARTVACTSNLRQLATAAHAYASANGAMPAAVLYRRDGGLLRTIAWDFEQCGGTVRPGPLWNYSSTP